MKGDRREVVHTFEGLLAAALASLGRDVRSAVSLYFSPFLALRRDFTDSTRRLRAFEADAGSHRARTR